MQNYTEGDILLILKMLQKEQVGRKRLSDYLGLGEATIRTLFRKLESEDLISSTRQGQKLTRKGDHFLVRVPQFTLPQLVEVGDVTLSRFNVASLIRGYVGHIKNGMQLRDAAIIAGACGSTTLIFSEGKLHFPDTTLLPSEVSHRLIDEFSPDEGDVLIIATAETERKAMRGLSGCLSLLIQEEMHKL